MALDTTVGGVNANSYASTSEADAYNAAHVEKAVWDDADPDVREAALLMATRLLDSSFRWTGAAVSSTQALTWPRIGMYSRNGFEIASTVIPVDLKNAQAEFARQLIENNNTTDNDALKQQISSVKAGPVAVSFGTKTASGTIALRNVDLQLQGPDYDWIWKGIPDAVRNLLVPSWYERPSLGTQMIFKASR